MLNIQPIQKQTLRTDGLIAIHSVFPTIQGEGPFAGQPAIFIRLAGCNLQCPGCDTDYTSVSDLLSIDEIISAVDAVFFGARTKYNRHPLVVITGGEPFRQNIAALVEMLIIKSYRVQIETNGTLYNPGMVRINANLTIVCSPKTGKLNSLLAPNIDAFKYVVKFGCVDPTDGLPILALDHSASPRVARPPEAFRGTIYVQPMDEQDPILNRKNLEQAMWSATTFGYTLCVQLHKIIGVD